MSSPLDLAIEKSGIEPSRVRRLNENDARATTAEFNAAGYDGAAFGSKYVLYYTCNSFRSQNNEALELAKALANELELPLVVLAHIDLRMFQKASKRHVLFVLEGVAEFEESLLEQGIGACVRIDPIQDVRGLSLIGDEAEGVTGFCSKAWAVVTDRPHLRFHIETVARVAAEAGCPVIDVETHLLVPFEEVFQETVRERSVFEERFLSLCPEYAKLLTHQEVNVTASEELMDEVDRYGLVFDFMRESEDDETWGAPDWLSHIDVLEQILEMSHINTEVGKAPGPYGGGENAARKLLAIFIARKLKGYARACELNEENNRCEYGSLLSPYLCYGFISNAEVASKILNAGRSMQDTTAFLRSLARREMGFNLVNTIPEYDDFTAVLSEDQRCVLEAKAEARPRMEFSEEAYKTGATSDTQWNTAQRDMVRVGRDLTTDRAYWCQRLLEMERNPAVAFERALKLSMLYMLDCLDPVIFHCITEVFARAAIDDAPRPDKSDTKVAQRETVTRGTAEIRQMESNMWNALKTSGVEESRVRLLNKCGTSPNGKYVLYWSQTAFRTTHNDSLEVAKSLAARAELPLLVLDVLDLDSWSTQSKRHIVFHLEGVVEFEEQIELDGAVFAFRVDPRGYGGLSLLGDPTKGVKGFVSDAWAIVTDRPHMKRQRELTQRLIDAVDIAVIDVESKLLMPLEVLVNPDTLIEPDFSAFSERFQANIKRFAKGLPPQDVHLPSGINLNVSSFGYRWDFEAHSWSAKEWLTNESQRDAMLKSCGIDINVAVVTTAFKGGESTAKRLLTTFVSRVLMGYGRASEVHGEKNRREYGSLLSPYLCHGFISPAEIAISVLRSGRSQEDTQSYLRNICKREHAFNKIYFEKDYDVYELAIPAEVRNALKGRSSKYTYSDLEWERGTTHDQRWNTVQHELLFKGREIVQDRRYWAQKLIEYEPDPKNAFRIMCLLNDKYMLDAGDACSYYNIIAAFQSASLGVQQQITAVEDAATMSTILEEEIEKAGLNMNKVRQVNELGPRPSMEQGGSAQYVLYVANRSCRLQQNEALELAKALANRAGLPLIYLYVIDLHFFRRGSKRHVNFLLEGLAELKNSLSDVGIKLILRVDPARFGENGMGGASVIGCEQEEIVGFASRAWVVVMDRGHLTYEREIAARIAAYAGCSVVDYENRLVIPIEDMAESLETDFERFSQRFFSLLKQFLHPVSPSALKHQIFSDLDLESLGFRWPFMSSWQWGPREWLDAENHMTQVLQENGVDPNVSVISGAYRGGESPARRLLSIFIQRKLKGYAVRAEHEGEASRSEYGSLLSPYLSYGMISPVDLAFEVMRVGSNPDDINAFIRALARREYSYNLVNYCDDYDNYDVVLSEEVKEALLMAVQKNNTYSYSDSEWAKGETHDAKWNTIQHELVFRGRDLVSDRYYWCQKIIEFERDPRNAYRLALMLNDKYMVDALDPISFRVIQECFIKMAEGALGNETAPVDAGQVLQLLEEILPETGVEGERICVLNEFSHRKPVEAGGSAEYVLYWMTSSFRKECNPSFEVAKALANKADLPLLVACVIDLNHYKSRSRRHVVFLLEGLAEAEQAFTHAGSGFRVCFEPVCEDTIGGLNLLGSADGKIDGFASKAWGIVVDKPHLRHDRELVERVAAGAGCVVVEVESRLVVPLEVAFGEACDSLPEISEFLELFEHMSDHFVKQLPSIPLDNRSGVELKSDTLGYTYGEKQETRGWSAREWLLGEEMLLQILRENGIDANVSSVSGTSRGGYRAAKKLLSTFLQRKLKGYAVKSAEEGERLRSEYGSLLSPYLSFGFISPVEVLFDLSKSSGQEQDSKTFKRSIGKREFAYAYVFYNRHGYDTFAHSVSERVRERLANESRRRRKVYSYTLEQWENGETHDAKWNSVQHELKFRGRDITQDRVFWCLKLIEYEQDAENAYRLACLLNDKYMLDADAIGFRNIVECFEMTANTKEVSDAREDPEFMKHVLSMVCPEVSVESSLVRPLNKLGPRPLASSRYVLYWCTTAPRRKNNPALQIAIGIANRAQLPLVVLNVIDLEAYQSASRRHIVFLLEGLQELQSNLSDMGAYAALRIDPNNKTLGGEGGASIVGNPSLEVEGFTKYAYAVVTDRMHLRYGVELQKSVAEKAGCAVLDVESKIIVPLEMMADEFIEDFNKFYEKFLPLSRKYACTYPLIPLQVQALSSAELSVDDLGWRWDHESREPWKARDWLNHEEQLSHVLGENDIDFKVSSVSGTYRGGEGSARRLLNIFITKKLMGYSTAQEVNGEKSRSEYGSLLSPYLTNGFISAGEIAFELFKHEGPDMQAFLKNLGRREQAFNFVRFTPGYDVFDVAVPADVQAALRKALAQRKVYQYTDDQWERGETHDSRWNTVQHELRFRGRDIAQDRYFWCIKLIEYEQELANAFRLAHKLNDKYMVDAMDAISFKNISDCFRSASLMDSRSAVAVEDRSVMEGILNNIMKESDVHPSRVQLINNTGPRPTVTDGGTAQYVLYWASGTCRRMQNEGLEIAKALANHSQLPLVVLFVLDMNVLKIGSKRHVVFLLEGLVELYSSLADLGIRLCVRIDPHIDSGGSMSASVLGNEALGVKGFASHAWAVVTDRSHLRYSRESVEKLKNVAGCSVIQVESRLIVPLEEALKEPHDMNFKVWLDRFTSISRDFAKKIVPINVDIRAGPELEMFHFGWRWPFTMSDEWTAKDWLQGDSVLNTVLAENGIDTSVPPVSGTYRGGEGAARKLMNTFIAKKLRGYNEEVGKSGENNRSEYGSLLSPYLCNGFISASELYLEILRSGRSEQDINSFLKNLARREFAFHFVSLNPDGYDRYEQAVPAEVRSKLAEIARYRDHRYVYTDEQWEKGETHDGRWNSVQHELMFRGRDIAQDRFFWLLKLVEYESDPQNAYRLAIKLNDKYMVDALDAIGYQNVADCFVKACEIEEQRFNETRNEAVASAFFDTMMKCLGPTEVEESRVRLVNSKGAPALRTQGGTGEYVLYYCTLSFRCNHNESLEIAKALANHAGLPLVVLVVIDLESYKTASIRHIIFLLEGLCEFERNLKERGIYMELRIEPRGGAPGLSVVGDSSRGIVGFGADAWVIVIDRAYLNRGRDIESRIAREVGCPVVEVESRLLVPLELSAEVMEDVVDAFFYRFFPLSNQFIKVIPEGTVKTQLSPALRRLLPTLGCLTVLSSNRHFTAEELANSYDVIRGMLETNSIPTDVSIASGYTGGERRGRELLADFVQRRLMGYSNLAEMYGEVNRQDYGSLLSPYLSFGFISVVEVAVEVLHSSASDADIIAFLRNLCRRELAYSFVYFNKDYDKYDGALPSMIRETLESVANNRGQRYTYTVEEWEKGETHDQQWNDVQLELVNSGRELMNDRVFWCEKIISYESKPSNAFALAIYLNDKYMIDALDPVGYKNIAECFNLASLSSGELSKTYERNPIRTLLKNAMDSCGVDKTRVRVLNDLGARAKVRKAKGGVGGEYVLYWASSAFRSSCNEALELAKALANMSSLPLVFLAVVNLNHYQRGSVRHIKFLLDGLAELENMLEEQGIAFCFRFETVSDVPLAENLIGDVDEKIVGFENRAWAIVTDRAHLRAPREMLKKAAIETGCALIEVETTLSVPLEKACAGPAPDFDSFYERFLPLCRKYAKPVAFQPIKVRADASQLGLEEMGKTFPFMRGKAWTVSQWLSNIDQLSAVLAENRVDTSVPIVAGLSGGEKTAQQLLRKFLSEKLRGYASALDEHGESNRRDYGSGLSAYLCFGFISLTEIMANIFEIANSDQTVVSAEDISAFLQNLARREMAFNFVHYTEKYDIYEGVLSPIVRKTLEEAGKKRKNYDYSLHQWENGETHDEKWNAVQKQLFELGRNLSHDRSFWCQKIIEYNRDPSKAFQIALSVNERLMIDALDAVSYRNISESFKLASLLVAPQTAIVARPTVPGSNKSDKSTMKALVKAALEDCGVERSRVRLLNDLGPRRAVNDNGTSEYVLYWMSSAFRTQHNESLEVAKMLANNAGLPLVVLIVLDLNALASCSKAHVAFLLQGFADVEASLEDQGIRVAFRVDPSEQGGGGAGGASVVGLENSNIIGFASRAWAVVTDRSHLRLGRACAKRIAGFAGCSVVEVESRLMVPVEIIGNTGLSSLEEFGERFFASLGQFTKSLPSNAVVLNANNRKLKLDVLGFQWDFMRGGGQWNVRTWMGNQEILDMVLRESGVDLSNMRSPLLGLGGENESKRVLQDFAADRLQGHASNGSRDEAIAKLYAYLSFGFLSPLSVVSTVVGVGAEADDLRAVLWKLARAELAHLRVYFNPGYAEYASCLDEQTRHGLDMMKMDMREPAVPEHVLERGEAPDPGWNSIQNVLTSFGVISMADMSRWVSGLIAFTYNPQEAFGLALKFVSTHALDLFGPMTYVTVADAFARVEKDYVANRRARGEAGHTPSYSTAYGGGYASYGMAPQAYARPEAAPVAPAPGAYTPRGEVLVAPGMVMDGGGRVLAAPPGYAPAPYARPMYAARARPAMIPQYYTTSPTAAPVVAPAVRAYSGPYAAAVPAATPPGMAPAARWATPAYR